MICIKIINYDRNGAIKYAKDWAYSRNLNYYNFDNIGGDCTNYISQCIYAGCNVMNYSKEEKGWYYNNINDRSPSWTSAKYLYEFLINNISIGPYGRKVSQDKIEIGDIIQLKFDKEHFSHSTIVVNINNSNNIEEIFVATHTIDSFNRRISSYKFTDIRFIHIERVRR